MCCFTLKADAFAKKLGYAVPLRAGLIKLQVICFFGFCCIALTT